MFETTIVITVKTEDPLCVQRERLTKNSEFIGYLIDDQDQLEMNDFEPDIVALFLTLLEDGKLTELRSSQFRELHKMATVFRVTWLKQECRNWLFTWLERTEDSEGEEADGEENVKTVEKPGKNKSGKERNKDTYQDLLFVFEECLFVLRKWEGAEMGMMETFIAKRAGKDNSSFVAKYLENFAKLDTIQLGWMLKMEVTNMAIFLEPLLIYIANKESLDRRIRFMLKNIDLVLCFSQHQQLYDQLFHFLREMEGLTRDDTSFILNLYMEAAESFRSNTEKAAKSARNSVKTSNSTFQPLETAKTKPSVVKSKKKVKNKSVEEENQRSRNVMLFGLKETHGEELTNKVDKIFKNLGFEMKHESKRVGKKNRRKPRPVKVSLIDSESAKQILRKSRESKVDEKVTMAPDRRESKVDEKVTMAPDRRESKVERKVTITPGPDRRESKVDEKVTMAPDRRESKVEGKVTITPGPDRRESKVDEKVTMAPDRRESKVERKVTITPGPDRRESKVEGKVTMASDRRESKVDEKVTIAPDRRESKVERKVTITPGPDRRESKVDEKVTIAPDRRESKVEGKVTITPDRRESKVEGNVTMAPVRRESKVDGKVTIAPDRSPGERAHWKLLKKETQQKKVKYPNKKHPVKELEGVVCSEVS